MVEINVQQCATTKTRQCNQKNKFNNFNVKGWELFTFMDFK